MPSFHPDCFNALYGTHETGWPSKYESRCTAGIKCLNGGTIKLGQRFVARKPENMPRPFGGAPAVQPQGSTIGELIKARLDAQKFDALLSQDLNAPEVTPSPDETGETPDVTPTTSETLEVPLDVLEITQRIVKMLAPILDAAVDAKLSSGLDPAKLAAGIKPILEGLVISEVSKLVRPNKMAEDITMKVLDKIASVTSTTVEVKNLDTGKTANIGVQHKQFPILLKAVSARINVWLAGPSGSGKTTAAMNVAKALDLEFRYTGAVGDQYALTGYKDANGKYVRTPFRDAWEFGGLFLWDEVDASDPNALLAFNAALANGSAPFPDAVITKHKDCVLVAAANTYGHGATTEYVGRLKMDAAFLKRFAFLSWEYDEQMELDTAPNKAWTQRVQAIRKKVKEQGLRVLVTPRESYIGASLLAAGIPQTLVEEMTIKSGMSNDQWASLNSRFAPIPATPRSW